MCPPFTPSCGHRDTGTERVCSAHPNRAYAPCFGSAPLQQANELDGEGSDRGRRASRTRRCRCCLRRVTPRKLVIANPAVRRLCPHTRTSPSQAARRVDRQHCGNHDQSQRIADQSDGDDVGAVEDRTCGSKSGGGGECEERDAHCGCYGARRHLATHLRGGEVGRGAGDDEQVQRQPSASAEAGDAGDNRRHCEPCRNKESSTNLGVDCGHAQAHRAQWLGRQRCSPVRCLAVWSESAQRASDRGVRTERNLVSDQLVAVDSGDVVGEVAGASCVGSAPAELERLVEESQPAFNRYLHDRGIVDTSASKVWCFIGDGEMDEPESLAGLAFAGRERLDNLIFVVNCNLQRLDGPVRGNGKIIQELEALYRGAGWNVIKVVWGREWDALLARDTGGALVAKINATVDGEFQKYRVETGAYIREHFFGPDPRLQDLVAHLSDDGLRRLRRGGHDPRKVHAAYSAAIAHRGAPTVVLTHTVKGWSLGPDFEARNATHQMKKTTEAELKTFRNRLDLPITDAQLAQELPPYVRPGVDSDEHRYLMARRQTLGGPQPARVVRPKSLVLPGEDLYREFMADTGDKVATSTTSAFTRLLKKLLRDPEVGRRVVPIIPDEARTFGIDALFRQSKIYAPPGQRYEPVDADMLLGYMESVDGQILEEGLTGAGSMASLIAAATAYATWGELMIPFFIFYSMFGFHRPGDLIWALGDMRGRGFLMAATAGRTTLQGEGLQHTDGYSHAWAGTIPNCPGLQPGLRLRTGGDRRRRNAPHVLSSTRGRLLLHHALQRDVPDAADARRRKRRHHPRSVPVSTRRRAASPPLPDPRQRHSDAGSAPSPTDVERRTRRRRRRVERDQLQATPRRSAQRRVVEPAPPHQPHPTPALRRRGARRRERADRGQSRTSSRRCPTR